MFWLQQKGNTEKHLRRQAGVYATSSGEGSIGAGALDEGAKAEGAEAEGAGAGRIKDTS
jgi:hypothetical protein